MIKLILAIYLMGVGVGWLPQWGCDEAVGITLCAALWALAAILDLAMEDTPCK